MADAQVFSYVDVLRTLRRSINKGGQLYSAESPSLHASRTHLLMCVARAADSGDYSGAQDLSSGQSRYVTLRTEVTETAPLAAS